MSTTEVDFGQVRRHLFDAVLLDTNAVRSLGISLDAAWFSELCEICRRADVPVAVIDVTLDEWTTQHRSMLQEKNSQVRAGLRFIEQISGTPIALSEITLPDNSAIKQFLKRQLEAQEVRIIETQPQEVADYIAEALNKVSPFEKGGKGFMDAVILDSIVAYAKTLKSQARVLVISDDAAVLRSQDRFDQSGVEVEFAKREEAKDKAASSLSSAENEFIRQRDAALLKHVRESEPRILQEFNEKPIKISNIFLRKALEDSKLGPLLPERIVGLRPKGVERVSVVYGYPESVVGLDRYRVHVYVQCEVDVVLSRFAVSTGSSIFGQTTITIDGTDVRTHLPIESPRMSGDEPEATQTILMSISIDGSIARQAFEQGSCEGFRVEDELSTEQWKELFRHQDDELPNTKQE